MFTTLTSIYTCVCNAGLRSSKGHTLQHSSHTVQVSSASLRSRHIHSNCTVAKKPPSSPTTSLDHSSINATAEPILDYLHQKTLESCHPFCTVLITSHVGLLTIFAHFIPFDYPVLSQFVSCRADELGSALLKTPAKPSSHVDSTHAEHTTCTCIAPHSTRCR